MSWGNAQTRNAVALPERLHRRTFLAGGSALAAGLTLALADPAGAVKHANEAGKKNSTVQTLTSDLIGLPVIDITAVPFLADTTGVLDSTAAIVAAIAAAGTAGRIFVPPGTYKILGASNGGGPIEISGNGLFEGSGATWDNVGTIFQCGDATAGIALTGAGMVRGFTVDGNNVATTPLVRQLSGGSGAYGTFENITVVNSAANGVTILGSQNDVWLNLCSIKHVQDGLYIDQGAGGLVFINFSVFDCGRYQIHGDNLVSGGPYPNGPQDIRFLYGICDNVDNGGVSGIYLRHCIDLTFDGMNMGPPSSGPTVDLDSSDQFIRFQHLIFQGVATGDNPGHACIQSNGCLSLSLNDMTFGGDTSVYFTADSLVRVNGQLFDTTTNGMVSAAGVIYPHAQVDGWALQWIKPTLLNGWTNLGGPYPEVAYRLGADGDLQMTGMITGGASNTAAFTFPTEFSPSTFRTISAYDNATLAIQLINGTWSVFVIGTGVVSLDGISLPRNI